MTANGRTPGRDDRGTVTIVMAGSVVLALAFGVRAVFGGIVQPLSDDLFGGRIEVFSLSIAIQNLVWGLAQPGFGIVADRFVAGMLICVVGTTPFAQHLGAGVLVGMGISGTAFGVVLAVVGRAAPEEKRGRYLGITSAMGSTGQVVLPLLVSWLVAWVDWRTTLVVVAFALAPMALCIPFLRAQAGSNLRGADGVSIAQTVGRAF
jgi:MFS family permease